MGGQERGETKRWGQIVDADSFCPHPVLDDIRTEERGEF